MKPTAEQWNRLPRPWLPEREGLLALYGAAWGIAANRGLRPAPAWRPGAPPFLDACFSENIFQWDSCFIAQWLRYQQGALLPESDALGLLDNFYAAQHDDGAIPRELRPDGSAEPCKHPQDEHPRTPVHGRHGAFTNPPLFAWAEWDYYRHTGDASRLPRVLQHVAAYFDWYTRHRSRPAGYLWFDNFGSGMDNLPRGDAWGWIDYTAQAALDSEAIANMALVVGDHSIAEACSANYLGFKELVSTKMWDPWEKRFGDVDDFEVVVGRWHLGLYWTLLADLATDEQRASLIAALQSPRHFARHHPLPVLSAADPEFQRHGAYWRGSVWPPMNYMVQRALRRSGERELARDVALRHLEAMERTFRRTGTIWENYSPSEDAPGSEARPDFCGWSAIGPIAGLIEDVLGIEVEGAFQRVDWWIGLDEPHGIDNLRVGPATISLRAVPAPRGWKVHAESTDSVELHLHGTTTRRVVDLEPGRPADLLVL